MRRQAGEGFEAFGEVVGGKEVGEMPAKLVESARPCRLYGNSRHVAAMPSLFMNIWDATFKEKGAGGYCGCRRLA